jgi:hypothetical protein
MEFKSNSVNNCYILGNELFENFFFTNIQAKAIYSASIFHLAFLKGDILSLEKKVLEQYQKISIDFYRMNSPYLKIPFEINFHEDKLYQAYYESDHFPLSVWLEEKQLIPFDLYLSIMEEILLGLKALNSLGYSHSFLTPEEILLPLEWNSKTHVKLTNIGISTIVPSFLSKKEILKYRDSYFKESLFPATTSLSVKEDLYSFGVIMGKLLLICDSSIEGNKDTIQSYLDSLLDKDNSFNSIDEVLDLFEDIFKIYRKSFIIPKKDTSIDYTGRASFDIPEFNEWREEGELLPFEETTENSRLKKNEILKNRVSFYTRISNFISGFFNSMRNKNDYNRNNMPSIPGEKFTEIKDNNVNEKIKTNSSVKNNMTSVLDQIEDHYKSTDSKQEESVNYTNGNEKESIIKENLNSEYSGNKKSERKIEDYSIQEGTYNYKVSKKNNNSKLNLDFNKALAERDYQCTFDIIKNTIDNNDFSKNNVLIEINNSLDKELLKIDRNYKPDYSQPTIRKLETLINSMPAEIPKDVDAIQLSEEKSQNTTGNIFSKIYMFIMSLINKMFRKN